jgi:hypothetical protein
MKDDPQMAQSLEAEKWRGTLWMDAFYFFCFCLFKMVLGSDEPFQGYFFQSKLTSVTPYYS